MHLWLDLQTWIGEHFYGSPMGHRQVYVVPRNRIVKKYCHPTEAAAMQFVRDNTTIPVPKIYKVYPAKRGRQHIVMERLPGTSACEPMKTWTDEQRDMFSRDLGDCLEQLRSLQPPSPQYVGSVGKAAEGKIYDERLSLNPCGPFTSIADFHTYVRFGRPLEDWANKPDVVKIHSHSEKYTSKFTHADLCPKNVMVDKKGHITGIIDWEYAGWYPEYWEYTKIYFMTTTVWQDFYDAIEKNPKIQKYHDEKDCELVFWTRSEPCCLAYAPAYKPGDEKEWVDPPRRQRIKAWFGQCFRG